jgi:hypothetical protein
MFWVEEFCRDFLSDAQALGLTRAKLPRTMRHRFEQESFELQIKISALARARGSWYKSEEKANIKQPSHAC